MRAPVFLIAVLTVSSLAACRCGGPQLQPVPSFVRVEPKQVDFGRVIVGQAAVQRVAVINDGKVALDGTWSLQGEGFHGDDAVPSRADVGRTEMTIICSPDHVGTFDGTLTVTLAGFEPLVVPLACEAVPVPECVPSSPCHASSWDVAAGRCVESNLDDGTVCSVNDVCLLNPACHAGRCEGTLKDCNDGDPCTADTCHPSLGCEHANSVVCPSTDPCRVGVCVPGQGCTLVDALDGVPCGQLRSCTRADVCISGQCVERDPPDGFACQGEGPCGGAGRCVNDACVANAASTLRPTWTEGVPQPDGGPPEQWADLFHTRTGGVVLSSYFMSPPRLEASSTMPTTLAQSARRCISWLGWLVCGDLPALASSPVSAIDPATGAIVWSFTGAAQAVPQFAGANVQFFTARLAVLNEDELLALYETRTMTPEGMDPRCRSFAMIVLDRAGQPLRSRFITDPIFDQCNHPHSYGVAVDAQSNVYLAFTPSGGDNPATTQADTTVFSFSPALLLRWRIEEATLEGGDLAVGNGLLFQERTTTVYSSSTGQAVAQLARPFGRGAIGQRVSLPLGEGVDRVDPIDLSTLAPGWHSTLTGTPGRAPITLAQWDSPWGPRDVALIFTDDQGTLRLEALELDTGASAFACPIALPEPPLETAMGEEGLSVMMPITPRTDGCERCDPRYARTRNAFAWVPLPGLHVANVPWAGSWANEGHSHREGR
ncbi:MAG: hypothetical protein U0228_12805 [Myxococcaceae bacterium]